MAQTKEFVVQAYLKSAEILEEVVAPCGHVAIPIRLTAATSAAMVSGWTGGCSSPVCRPESSGPFVTQI